MFCEARLLSKFQEKKGKPYQENGHDDSKTNSDTTGTSSSGSKSFVFTLEKYQSLIVVLKQLHKNSTPKANVVSSFPLALRSKSSHNDGKNPHLLILDTSATNHITFTLTSFSLYLLEKYNNVALYS